MVSESASNRILTRAEVKTAGKKAAAHSRELAEEVYGANTPFDTLDSEEKGENEIEKRHTKKTYAAKVDVLIELFFAKLKSGEDTFSTKKLFDFLNLQLAPTCVSSRDGMIRVKEEDDIREYHAATQQLLTALDLLKQFQQYNRDNRAENSPVNQV